MCIPAQFGCNCAGAAIIVRKIYLADYQQVPVMYAVLAVAYTLLAVSDVYVVCSCLKGIQCAVVA